MKQYRLWVRINSLQTANTLVYASDAYTAKLYGAGNVLSYTEV